jgi:hypothetical protein
MSLTIERATRHINHALNGPASDPESALSILNQAGEFLTTMHTWKWLERGPTTVGLVADQSYIILPTDLRDIIAMEPTSSLSIDMERSTHGEVLWRSTDVNGGDSWPYWGAISYHTNASGALVPRLDLSDTPSTSDADAFTIVYRAGWTELDSSDETIPLPSWMEPLYIEVVRAYAMGWEEEEGVGVLPRLDAIMASGACRMVKQRDGMIQGSIGPLKNGAASRGQNTRRWDATTVEPPA